VNFSKGNYCEEYIGGFNGGPLSVTITAAIDSILPYEGQGAHSTVRVALSDQMAMNTIFGISFQKKCGFNLNLQNDTLSSPVFAETYKIEYGVPPLDDELNVQSLVAGVSLLAAVGPGLSEKE